MELDVQERLVLLQILPREGDLTTLRIVSDLRAALSFSEEEHKYHNFRQEGDVSLWEHNEKTKKVEVGPKALQIIRERIEYLSKEKKLHIDFLAVCERFLEDTYA